MQAWADATSDQFEASPEPPAHPPPPPPLGVAGDAAASIAAVYTAFEFQGAFHEGVRDIEIHAHLDLRKLPIPPNPLVPVPGSQEAFQIGYLGSPIRSIRVRIWLLSHPINLVPSCSSHEASTTHSKPTRSQPSMLRVSCDSHDT